MCARIVSVRAAIALRLTLALPFLACGTGSSDDDADELETGAGSTDGPGSDDSAGPSSGDEPQPLPPAHSAELRPWLEAGEYLDWQVESGVHPSTGPHFGGVRTFVNDVLYDSLATGASSHPEGSAAIKELYGSGDTVRGWSVEIKLQADSAGGDGWYWYEGYQDSVYADGTGDGGCTGCHGGGSDYVLTPFPLQ
jgi:hypothetical protein